MLPTSAWAALMPHYDLSSLALLADAVVRGHVVAERRVDPYTVLRTLQIDESFAGELAVGSRVELDYELYALRPLFPDREQRMHPPELGVDIVAFLQRRRGARAAHEPEWDVISSGLRIFLDGVAQRFEQAGNPGGFEPVPQGHDPYDLLRDPRAGKGLDRAGLEGEIRAAVAHAARAREQLESPSSPLQQRRWIELAGLPNGESPQRFVGGFRNAVAERALARLASDASLSLLLEGVAASVGVSLLELRQPHSVQAVLAVANDQASSVEQRVAALRLVDGMTFDLWRWPEAEAHALPLLADAEPRVRRAALELAPTRTASAGWIDALVGRFALESDDSTRLAVLRAVQAHGRLARLDAPAGSTPLFAVTQFADRIRLSYGDTHDGLNWVVGHASRLHLRREGAEHIVALYESTAGYSNGSIGHFDVLLPKLAAPSEAELNVILEELDGRSAPIARTFTLGTLLPSRTAEDAGTAPSLVEPPRRGRCQCDLAETAAAETPTWLPWLSLLFMRRRRDL